MNKTFNLDLNLLKYNQVQKEILVNEAIGTLDAFVSRSIVASISDLSKANKTGELYIVSNNQELEGELSKKGGLIVFYVNGWRYIKPKNGWVFFFQEQSKFFQCKEGVWLDL